VFAVHVTLQNGTRLYYMDRSSPLNFIRMTVNLVMMTCISGASGTKKCPETSDIVTSRTERQNNSCKLPTS
jgi:hypothetical protein